ncbi:MAG: AraC family transcriptional regulator [Abditibacteriaceae bacterium]
MPFETKIRKQILTALDEHIIPLLQTKTVAQLLAQPPFYSIGVETMVEQKVLLLNKNNNPLNVRLEWEEEQLCSRRMALLGFNYSGISLERVGITRQISKDLRQRNLPVPPGITAFRLASPGALYIPSHVPHHGRSLSEDENTHRMLLLWFTEQELWVTHHDAIEGGVHNLYIADPAFQEMKQAYVQTLEKQESLPAQMLLSNLMQRLSSYLKGHQARVSNSAWPTFAPKSVLVAPHVSTRNARYCYKVVDYVQFHLDTQLSLEVLAKFCGVTVPHLSTIFHKSTGITLMNYVTAHRLRSAEMMLTSTSERIADIAKLTGFASSHSFAGAFRRRFGMSASQYRQQNSIERS